jgi:FHA domain
MSFVCRRGHHSISDDFCDVCGAKNRNVRQSFMAGVPATGPSIRTCPVCSAPWEGAARHCPNCSYDFATGERFGPIIPTPVPAPAGPPQPIVLPRLVLVLSVDPAGADDAGADDAGAAGRWPDPWEHVFSLDGSPTVIGRADTPGLQIPIRGDPFVSRRHAEIVELGVDWGVRDLGSTNGTRLNGVALVGTEVRPITAGDVIEVGHSSRLTILPAR